MFSKNLPVKGFQKLFSKLYEDVKNAPALYIKEKKLSEARRLKNMALAMEAMEMAGYAGKLICLIERDIAESNPPIPKKKTGRGHKKSVAGDATLSKFKLSHIRKAFKNLSEAQVLRMADDAIESGHIPTREMFLRGLEFYDIAPRLAGRDGHAEYYTPPEIIELARKTMGSIDLDPCSNNYAQGYIKAKEFWTKEDNGLKRPWAGNVWLNPPYIYKEIDKWINKLMREREG